MIVEAVFFFIYIKFFDIKNHLLLHAVFIVIEVIDFFKSIDDAGLYFLGSLFFEGGDFGQQMCDIPDFLSKQFLQHEAFLGTEFYKMADGVFYCFFYGETFIFRCFYRFVFQCVG